MRESEHFLSEDFMNFRKQMFSGETKTKTVFSTLDTDSETSTVICELIKKPGNKNRTKVNDFLLSIDTFIYFSLDIYSGVYRQIG